MGGITELGFNLPVLIAQIVNVFLLFGLMYLVAYKPVMRMLDTRSKRIEEDMGQREHIEAERARAEEETNKILENARQEGQEIRAQAAKDGMEIKEKAQQEAQQEAQALLDRERVLIQQEREEAAEELRREFADLTIMAAEKIIERSLNKEEHRQLIDKVLEECGAQKKD